ncbi:MAG: class I SAM-dependent methyltransferase [Lachnospiraceae bacterium]|nr:class I SAM-dependent methyltransferase [Lachnospiraceae bacterium]
MNLSKRLNAVANLVTPGNRLADVGTDHGYIPIELIKAGRIPWAAALDINKGPLQRAAEHIRREGLEKQIETRLSDGLAKVRVQEADSVVIAGMGGGLTIQILERGEEILPSLKELILQPQSEIEKVRRWLENHDFSIQEEDMVLEDGKFYPMMRAVHGSMRLSGEIDAKYGPVLLHNKNSCLLEFLRWEAGIKEQVKERLQQSGGDSAAQRMLEVEQALRWNQEAQLEFEKNKGCGQKMKNYVLYAAESDRAICNLGLFDCQEDALEYARENRDGVTKEDYIVQEEWRAHFQREKENRF